MHRNLPLLTAALLAIAWASAAPGAPGAGTDLGPARGQARLVDLYPTAAVLLGADPRDAAFAELDGRPLPCVSGPRP